MAAPIVGIAPTSRARTLLVNNLWLVVSAGSSLVAGLLTSVVNSRYLGLIVFGQYSLLQANASYWGISGGGIGTILLKSAARNEESTAELIGAGALLQTAFAAATLAVAMPIAAWSLRDSRTVIPAFLMGITGVLLSAINSPLMVFSGKNRMQWQILNSFQALGSLGLLIFVVRTFRHIGLYAPILSTFAFATIVCTGVYLYVRHKEGELHLPPAPALKRLAFAGLSLTVLPLANLVYYQLDSLLVSWISPGSELGILGAANRLVIVFRQMAWVVVMGALPLLVVDARREHKELNKMVNNSLLLLVLGGGVVTSVVIGASSLIVAILYPKEFSAASNVLCAYALCFVPLLVHWIIMNTLVVADKSLSLGIPYLVASLVKVIGGLYIIRTYGALGMAALSLGAEVLLASIFCVMLMYARGFRFDSKFARAIGWVTLCLLFVFAIPVLPRWSAGMLGALAVGVGGIYITGLHFDQLRFLIRAIREGKPEEAGL